MTGQAAEEARPAEFFAVVPYGRSPIPQGCWQTRPRAIWFHGAVFFLTDGPVKGAGCRTYSCCWPGVRGSLSAARRVPSERIGEGSCGQVFSRYCPNRGRLDAATL